MPELNHQRSLVAHLRDICAQRGIALSSFSDDWLFCLQKNGRVSYIFGYDFGINSATARMICKDKSATSDLLGFHGIPRIPHTLFHGPGLAGYIPASGNWRAMLDFLQQHPAGVVCKPNEGTGGNAVFLTKTEAQLEAAVYKIFSRDRSLCLSPFENFAHEYRATVLFGEVQFIYRKERPSLTGDGVLTVRQIYWQHLERTKSPLAMKEDQEIPWEKVPAAGETVVLNWRHNLGQGATPTVLTSSHAEFPGIAQLAQQAVAALGIELASVDIAATDTGLKVLEINSGIMMESLEKQHPDGKSMARAFYDRIICRALHISDAEKENESNSR